MMLSEEINNELEALRAIYAEDFLERPPVWKRPCFAIKTRPITSLNGEVYCEAIILFTLVLKYPAVVPKLEIESSSGLSTSEVKELLETINDVAKDLIGQGEVMCHDIITAAQTFLESHNVKPETFYEAMISREKREHDVLQQLRGASAGGGSGGGGGGIYDDMERPDDDDVLLHHQHSRTSPARPPSLQHPNSLPVAPVIPESINSRSSRRGGVAGIGIHPAASTATTTTYASMAAAAGISSSNNNPNRSNITPGATVAESSAANTTAVEAKKSWMKLLLDDEDEDEDDDDAGEEEEEEEASAVSPGYLGNNNTKQKRVSSTAVRRSHNNKDNNKDNNDNDNTNNSTGVLVGPSQWSRYRQEFLELARIGSGASGFVWKVRHRLDRRVYAVKKVDLTAAGNASAGPGKIRREVTTISRLVHKHIVRYYAAWMEEEEMEDAVAGNGSSNSGSSYSRSHSPATARGDRDGDGEPSSSSTSSDSFSPRTLQYIAMGGRHSHTSAVKYKTNKSSSSSSNDNNKGANLSSGSGTSSNSNNINGDDDDDDDDDDLVDFVYSDNDDPSNIEDDDDDDYSSTSSGSSEDDEDDEDEDDDGQQSPSRRPDVSPMWGRNGSAAAAIATAQVKTAVATAVVSARQSRRILFIQMEFCYTTLRDVIDKHDLWKQPNEIVKLLRQVLEALAYIHNRRVIHRDLKPANIFLDGEGNIKIGDFGLATFRSDRPSVSAAPAPPLPSSSMNEARTASKKAFLPYASLAMDSSSEGAGDKPHSSQASDVHLADSHPPSHTAGTGTYPGTAGTGSETSNASDLTGGIGTAMYRAPEQEARRFDSNSNSNSNSSKNYDEKADMFSLGVILFEMCHPPFSTGMERLLTLRRLREHAELPSDFGSSKLALPVPTSSSSSSSSSSSAARAVQSEKEKSKEEDEGEETVQASVNTYGSHALGSIIKWLVQANPIERPSALQLLESDLLPARLDTDGAYLREITEALWKRGQSSSSSSSTAAGILSVLFDSSITKQTQEASSSSFFPSSSSSSSSHAAAVTTTSSSMGPASGSAGAAGRDATGVGAISAEDVAADGPALVSATLAYDVHILQQHVEQLRPRFLPHVQTKIPVSINTSSSSQPSMTGGGGTAAASVASNANRSARKQQQQQQQSQTQSSQQSQVMTSKDPLRTVLSLHFASAIKAQLRQVFSSHGAVHFAPDLLQLRGTAGLTSLLDGRNSDGGRGRGGGFVQFLDAAGRVVVLSPDLLSPFAKVAATLGLRHAQHYHIGSVFSSGSSDSGEEEDGRGVNVNVNVNVGGSNVVAMAEGEGCEHPQVMEEALYDVILPLTLEDDDEEDEEDEGLGVGVGASPSNTHQWGIHYADIGKEQQQHEQLRRQQLRQARLRQFQQRQELLADTEVLTAALEVVWRLHNFLPDTAVRLTDARILDALWDICAWDLPIAPPAASTERRPSASASASALALGPLQIKGQGGGAEKEKKEKSQSSTAGHQQQQQQQREGRHYYVGQIAKESLLRVLSLAADSVMTDAEVRKLLHGLALPPLFEKRLLPFVEVLRSQLTLSPVEVLDRLEVEFYRTDVIIGIQKRLAARATAGSTTKESATTSGTTTTPSLSAPMPTIKGLTLSSQSSISSNSPAQTNTTSSTTTVPTVKAATTAARKVAPDFTPINLSSIGKQQNTGKKKHATAKEEEESTTASAAPATSATATQRSVAPTAASLVEQREREDRRRIRRIIKAFDAAVVHLRQVALAGMHSLQLMRRADEPDESAAAAGGDADPSKSLVTRRSSVVLLIDLGKDPRYASSRGNGGASSIGGGGGGGLGRRRGTPVPVQTGGMYFVVECYLFPSEQHLQQQLLKLREKEKAFRNATAAAATAAVGIGNKGKGGSKGTNTTTTTTTTTSASSAQQQAHVPGLLLLSRDQLLLRSARRRHRGGAANPLPEAQAPTGLGMAASGFVAPAAAAAAASVTMTGVLGEGGHFEALLDAYSQQQQLFAGPFGGVASFPTNSCSNTVTACALRLHIDVLVALIAKYENRQRKLVPVLPTLAFASASSTGTSGPMSTSSSSTAATASLGSASSASASALAAKYVFARRFGHPMRTLLDASAGGGGGGGSGSTGSLAGTSSGRNECVLDAMVVPLAAHSSSSSAAAAAAVATAAAAVTQVVRLLRHYGVRASTEAPHQLHGGGSVGSIVPHAHQRRHRKPKIDTEGAAGATKHQMLHVSDLCRSAGIPFAVFVHQSPSPSATIAATAEAAASDTYSSTSSGPAAASATVLCTVRYCCAQMFQYGGKGTTSSSSSSRNAEEKEMAAAGVEEENNEIEDEIVVPLSEDLPNILHACLQQRGWFALYRCCNRGAGAGAGAGTGSGSIRAEERSLAIAAATVALVKEAKLAAAGTAIGGTSGGSMNSSALYAAAAAASSSTASIASATPFSPVLFPQHSVAGQSPLRSLSNVSDVSVHSSSSSTVALGQRGVDSGLYNNNGTSIDYSASRVAVPLVILDAPGASGADSTGSGGGWGSSSRDRDGHTKGWQEYSNAKEKKQGLQRRREHAQLPQKVAAALAAQPFFSSSSSSSSSPLSLSQQQEEMSSASSAASSSGVQCDVSGRSSSSSGGGGVLPTVSLRGMSAPVPSGSHGAGSGSYSNGLIVVAVDASFGLVRNLNSLLMTTLRQKAPGNSIYSSAAAQSQQQQQQQSSRGSGNSQQQQSRLVKQQQQQQHALNAYLREEVEALAAAAERTGGGGGVNSSSGSSSSSSSSSSSGRSMPSTTTSRKVVKQLISQLTLYAKQVLQQQSAMSSSSSSSTSSSNYSSSSGAAGSNSIRGGGGGTSSALLRVFVYSIQDDLMDYLCCDAANLANSRLS